MSSAKLDGIRDSLDFNFTEMARLARKQARRAKLSGDKDLSNAILDGLEKADKERLDAESKMMVANLTSDQTEALISGLDQKSEDAKVYLKNLRKAKDVIETLKKAAKLAATVLGIVTDIVG